MTSFGEKLKAAREQLHWSIERVSYESRISPIVIQCIEANDFSVFASPAYAKGFLRKYCGCLGLDLREEIDQVVFVGFPEYDSLLHLKCLPETLESSEISKKSQRYQRANYKRESPVFLSGAIVGIFCMAAMFYFMASQANVAKYGVGNMVENFEDNPAFSRNPASISKTVVSNAKMVKTKMAKKQPLELAGQKAMPEAKPVKKKAVIKEPLSPVSALREVDGKKSLKDND